MALTQYSVHYTGGIVAQTPGPKTFAQLGVTACKIVSVAGGGDYAELTVDVSVGKVGLPFVPLARHDIYDGGGTLRFVGWLMQPARAATPSRQQQTFRLEGPMSQLANRVYQQRWNFATDPNDYNSAVSPEIIPRVILNLEDDTTLTRINVAKQIKNVLDYYIGLYGGGLAAPAPIQYGNLAAIPAVQPPEDEQTDTYCDTILQRELRWVPKVTAYWTYPAEIPVRPMLNFSANDAVPAGNIVGNVAIVPGGGLVPLNGYQSVLIDPTSGKLASFKSTPRYDLLVSKVAVFYQSEQEVTDDGSPTGTRKVWATLAPLDLSTADNGSAKHITYCFDLRGGGGLRDPETGLPETSPEAIPSGLAAALHEPFKVLTHSLEWSIVGADVDWLSIVGAAVGVRNGGDDLLAGSRSILQQISRDIASGTTSYQAGPPTHLGIDDIVALTRFNRTRNAARNGGGSGGGGYSKAGGPDQRTHGTITPTTTTGGGGSGGHSALWYQIIANGLVAYAQIDSTTPVATLPAGAVVVNPN